MLRYGSSIADVERRARARRSTTSAASASQPRFLLGQSGGQEVADQQLHRRAIDARLDDVGMHEPVVAVGRLRRQPVGRQALDEARRQLDGVHHAPLRVAGVRVEAVERDGDGVGREALELELAARRRRPSCRRSAAPKRTTSKCFVPRPISSSGVNAMRMSPCGISGCAIRHSAAVTISATPALVVGAEQRRARRGDDVVAEALRRGTACRPTRSTAEGSSGSTRSRPS